MRNLRCIFGHQFGDWEYTGLHTDKSDASNCEQTRVCLKDGFEEKRYKHQWLSDDEYHWCQNCPQKEHHNWSQTTTVECLEDTYRNRGGGGWTSVYGIYEESTCRDCGRVVAKKIGERPQTTPMPPD